MLKSFIGLIDYAMYHVHIPVKDPAPSKEFQQGAIEQAAAKRERKRLKRRAVRLAAAKRERERECLKRIANNLTKE